MECFRLIIIVRIFIETNLKFDAINLFRFSNRLTCKCFHFAAVFRIKKIINFEHACTYVRSWNRYKPLDCNNYEFAAYKVVWCIGQFYVHCAKYDWFITLINVSSLNIGFALMFDCKFHDISAQTVFSLFEKWLCSYSKLCWFIGFKSMF